MSVSGVRRRGAVQHVRGEHPDVLLDVPDVLLDVVDVLLDVVDVLRDAGVRFPVLGAHVIYAPVRTVHERVTSRRRAQRPP